jgi:hypothetical protein
MARRTRTLSLSGFTPIGPGGALGGSAGPSANSSECVFQAWKTTTYFIYGKWKRFWQYGTEPTIGGNNMASACPQVLGNYVTLDGTVVADVKKVSASFCSGAWQPLGVQLFLDDYYNTSGGYGVSGAFGTNQIGYTRIAGWDANVDVESYCAEPFQTTLSVQDGEYAPALDTSANFKSDFAKALFDAKRVCPNFDPGIVAM